MVYCGKPSRGCQMCRTRRIKCDETKPTCTQCQKSRRVCPGYKDDFDLVFRNETQATEKRAKKSSNKPKRIGSQVVIPLNQRRDSEAIPSGQNIGGEIFKQVLATELTPSANAVPGALTLPIEQIATDFFFSNFVAVPHDGGSRGFLGYMIPLANADPSNRHLSLAFSAVKFAALGNKPNAKSLLWKAEQQYSMAIRHVNRALRDPVDQKTDQTLAAVLLLGLFETILSRRVTMGAWGSHIDGAVMIVKMRGKKQLRTKVGNALFVAVRTQMIINSLATGKTPDWGVDQWMADANGRNENADEVNRLSLQVAEIRSEINSLMTRVDRTPENIALVLDAMRRVFDLEQGFLDWMAQLPEVWKVKTVTWVDHVPSEDLLNSEVYPGKIDVFSDIWIASVWNLVRVARLFISGAIVRCAAWINAPVDYRTTPEYASAARLGVDMVNDIIAAVPYHLGWTSNKEFTKEFGLAGGEGFACGGSQEAPRSLGAYVCVWPLFSTYCSDFTTDAQRHWAKGRLNYITDTMGINQAGTLSGYQLRLPSMTVMRDSMGFAMPLASKSGTSYAVPSNSSSYPPYPTTSIPESSTDSPATAATYNPTSTSPPVYRAYPPSSNSASAYSTSKASTPASGASYSQSSYPSSNSSSSVPPQMASQYPYFQRQESPPEVHLQATIDDVGRKQRELWERERQKRALEKKKEELVDAATGGDANLAELIERYMAVRMFDK